MSTTHTEHPVQTLHIHKQLPIAAPLDIVFATLLDSPMPHANMALKIEPFPGGRWYRDLGHNSGHLWGHVQVIKPPTLLELSGPMFMSYPGLNHIQYRLAEEPGSKGQGTLLTLTHTALGLITAEHLAGVQKGWSEILDAIRAASEKKSAKR